MQEDLIARVTGRGQKEVTPKDVFTRSFKLKSMLKVKDN